MLMLAIVSAFLLAFLFQLPFWLLRYAPSSWMPTTSYILFPIASLSRAFCIGLILIILNKAKPFWSCMGFAILGGSCPLVLAYLEMFFWTRVQQRQDWDLFVIMLTARILAWLVWITILAWKVESVLRKQYQMNKNV